MRRLIIIILLLALAVPALAEDLPENPRVDWHLKYLKLQVETAALVAKLQNAQENQIILQEVIKQMQQRNVNKARREAEQALKEYKDSLNKTSK